MSIKDLEEAIAGTAGPGESQLENCGQETCKELVKLRGRLSSYRGRRALGSEKINALFVVKSQYSVFFPCT